jgi:hypothetical protein
MKSLIALTDIASITMPARCAYDWFGGSNERGVAVGDPVTGSCQDGINPRGLNLNKGAKSVLAYQHMTIAMRNLLALSA